MLLNYEDRGLIHKVFTTGNRVILFEEIRKQYPTGHCQASAFQPGCSFKVSFPQPIKYYLK